MSKIQAKAQKEKDNLVVACMFASSVKQEISHFDVVAAQSAAQY